jgi:hypothetical protein
VRKRLNAKDEKLRNKYSLETKTTDRLKVRRAMEASLLWYVLWAGLREDHAGEAYCFSVSTSRSFTEALKRITHT